MGARVTTTTVDGREHTIGTFNGATDVWEAHAMAARYAVALLAQHGGRVDPMEGERGRGTMLVTPDQRDPETIRVREDS